MNVPNTSLLANDHMEQTGTKATHIELIYNAMLLPAFIEGNIDRIANFCQLRDTQVHKRLSEMERCGMIINTGKEAELKSGRLGIVWKAIPNVQYTKIETTNKRPAKDNWIKVSDQLPPQYTTILFWVNNDEPHCSVGYYEEGSGFISNIQEFWYSTCYISHWQHLPEAPRH